MVSAGFWISSEGRPILSTLIVSPEYPFKNTSIFTLLLYIPARTSKIPPSVDIIAVLPPESDRIDVSFSVVMSSTYNFLGFSSLKLATFSAMSVRSVSDALPLAYWVSIVFFLLSRADLRIREASNLPAFVLL